MIVVYTVHLYAAESVFALRRLDTGYFVHHHDRGLFWRVLVSGVLATGYRLRQPRFGFYMLSVW